MTKSTAGGAAEPDLRRGVRERGGEPSGEHPRGAREHAEPRGGGQLQVEAGAAHGRLRLQAARLRRQEVGVRRGATARVSS